MNVAWRHQRADLLRPVDAAFPTGRLVLDPPTVAAAIEVTMGPVNGAGPGRLRDVHYYPGRMLRAVHELADGRIIAVDAVPTGRTVVPAGGQCELPGLPALARVFPADPGLASLPSVLREVGPTAQLFTWLPGRRAVLADADRVIRMDNAIDMVAAHRRHLALSRALREVAVPAPIAVDPRRGVRWEARVDGLPIEHSIADLPSEVLAAMVSRAAAGLHRCLPGMHSAGLPAELLPDRGSAPLLDRLRRKTQRTVGRALPDLAARFSAVLDTLERSRPEPGRRVLVHGDLHVANALLTASGLVVLDVDEMGAGDPELDLAMFASRMLLIALHQGTGLGQAARFTELLPEVYAQDAHTPIDRSTYAWYLAAMLVGRQVKTSIRHLAPDLEPLCAELVGLAERTLAADRFEADLVVPVGV